MKSSPVTDLILFNFSAFPTDYSHPPHLHHYHQLDVVLDGRVTMTLEGQSPVLRTAGNAWLIPPLVRHGYEIEAGYRHASFKFHLAPRYWPIFGTHSHHFSASGSLCKELEDGGLCYREQALLSHPQLLALATLCLVQCAAQIQNAADCEDDNLDELRALLWPLLERIENEPRAGWTVSRIAAECHLSCDHFSRCFHHILGQTPQSYLLEVRMRAAAASLMVAPLRPLKEVAADAGYAGIYSFSRAFKQVFGMGPAAYRKAPREI